jgi:hypothetical protein
MFSTLDNLGYANMVANEGGVKSMEPRGSRQSLACVGHQSCLVLSCVGLLT